MKVPIQSLHRQYLSVKSEIDSAIETCITNSTFVGGAMVEVFEQEFASFCGVNHCITCANGTDAIEIALTALGIGPGDEVIVPAHSWISTSESVSNVGAKPVFVDTTANTFSINFRAIEEKITPRVKAIIPVHLYGLPAEMDEIIRIARRHNLYVVEDCAQAHGAQYKGKSVGTFGTIATFSFYPGKNLGAYGDGGAIITNDQGLATKCRLICNHGQISKNVHVTDGRNSRLDTIQAAVLSVKLKQLSKWNQRRNVIAKLYEELLSGVDIELPVVPLGMYHVYHLFVVKVNNRDEVMAKLAETGIETAIHYPSMLPFLPVYDYQRHQFPVCGAYQDKLLTLPMFPEMDEQEIEYVCKTLVSVL
jgi:dTDP-4-amino-4,6-dideoxygalactose transaminase